MKHVYVMQAPDGFVKVGISSTPMRRQREVRTYYGHKATVAFLTPLKPNPLWIESLAHSALQPKKINGEWFSATVEEAAEAVVAAVGMAEGDCEAYKAMEEERWRVRQQIEADKEAFLSSGIVTEMSEDDLERARFMRLAGDDRDRIAWSLNVSRATIRHYREQIAQEPQPWVPPEPWTPSPKS